jgi:muramoyltetrapeptide carboxypeptidase LdcA involved in peptidoglycan recycling
LPQMFESHLQQILQTPYTKYIKWIVVGRFQKKNSPSIENLQKIFSSKEQLKGIPIIANVNFGHAMPISTFPIWWMGKIVAHKDKSGIQILEH